MLNRRINGVWFGPRLSNLQKLCIRSYQNCGHEFHLYVDRPTEGIPEDTVIHDVNKVVDVPRLRPRFICESHFSDYFRAILIERNGGWYVDLDTVCLRPFDFAEPFVFVSENQFGGMRDVSQPTIPASVVPTNLLNGCIFKAPQHAQFLQCIIGRIEAMDTAHLRLPQDWIMVGPQMFREEVPRFNLQQYVKSPKTFDAVSPNELYHFINGGIHWTIAEDSYTIHLRSSIWKSDQNLNPDGRYHPDSLFEQLKRKHGVR